VQKKNNNTACVDVDNDCIQPQWTRPTARWGIKEVGMFDCIKKGIPVDGDSYLAGKKKLSGEECWDWGKGVDGQRGRNWIWWVNPQEFLGHPPEKCITKAALVPRGKHRYQDLGPLQENWRGD